MRRTRVGIDAWGLSGEMYCTGMGQYTAQLLRHLPRHCQGLEFIAYGAPAEPRPAWLPDEVIWRPVGVPLPAKLAALDSRLRALPRLTHRDGLGVFHAPSVHARPLFPPVPRGSCPVVVTLHDLIPATYYSLSELPIRQRLFYQWNLRRVLSADALVTVSFSSQEDICGYAGLAPERVRVIPNAVDFVAEPDPGPLARLGVKKPYVLYAGSYEPRKNLAQALLVFASLIARGYPHDLVALVERDSGHAKGVLSELAKLGLGARVHLVHSLPDDDVRRLYTHAEVLFFPTLAEGFGYPVLQAALVGLPVAASDLPVLREVAGDAALFFDPREVDDMLSALARLLGSVQLREQLAIKGRRRAGYFRVDAWVESHIDVYERLSRIPVAA